MGPYESPTFLGSKEKVALGLTFPQIFIALGAVGSLLTFWLIMREYVGMIAAGIGFLLSLILFVVISSVKIGGVKIPAYLMKMSLMAVRRPAFYGDAVAVIQAPPPEPTVPLDDEEPVVEPHFLKKLFSRGGSKAKAVATDQENRYMAQAQVDSAMANGVAEGRRQMRSILKEFRAFLPRFRR